MDPEILWCERCGEAPATKRTDETSECAECYAETVAEDPAAEMIDTKEG